MLRLLGNGYDQKQISVVVGETSLIATTYYATNKDADLHPFDWYKDYVICGAREHRLPVDYIECIDEVKAVRDPDPQRRAREYAALADCNPMA